MLDITKKLLEDKYALWDETITVNMYEGILDDLKTVDIPLSSILMNMFLEATELPEEEYTKIEPIMDRLIDAIGISNE
jgi:hypothetical protein